MLLDSDWLGAMTTSFGEPLSNIQSKTSLTQFQSVLSNPVAGHESEEISAIPPLSLMRKLQRDLSIAKSLLQAEQMK